MNQSELPRLRAEIAVRAVGDEFVAYDPENDSFMLLNVTAAFVLERCDGTNSPAGIAAEVRDAFSGSGAAVFDEVAAVLSRFRASGLLEP